MTYVDTTYLAYLTTNRNFTAPVVEPAIESLNLAAGTRVLDAGAGGGAALPALARAVGATGSVVAVDNEPAVVALASDYAEQTGIADRVTVQLGDINEVLVDAATAPEKAFDAIWAHDVVYSMYVKEPADTVQQMAQALRPGGVVALCYSNYYRSTFLTGHSHLERGLYAASEIYWGMSGDGPQHKERQLTWLQDAGLNNVSLTVFPLVFFPVDADSIVRPFLEQGVWPTMRKILATHGAEVGLSAAEVNELQRLMDPGDPQYVLDEPGYFFVMPATLATGRRPA
jgi:SAM-dependent methyltransferase